ncbi:MAG TPA: CHAT domain-containing protein [Thermoanaerobaculia bacterium]|nr:CHAT domain-containing protein [Thermoanaerobaculia bacterium]
MIDSLDLSILDSGSPDHAVAIARRGSDVALATIPFGSELGELTSFRNRIEDAVRGKQTRPKAKELTDYGRRLFEFAIRGDILALYDRLAATTDVRLHILSNQPQLRNLPFEYLQEPRRRPGPSLERSVIRVVPTIGIDPVAPIRCSPLRVLFVSSDPTDQGPVSWPEVKSRIERTFQARLPAGKVVFEAVESPDRRRLREILAEKEFDILHFHGHGDVEGGTGRIILTKRGDKSDYVTSDKFAAMLSDRGLKLVVLSACDTATGNFQDDFSVTAESLIRSGIPAVVANQLPIPDASVATFVGPLYETLLRTGDIDLAMNEGRMALSIELESADDATLEWGIPTLYRHFSMSQLYEP